MELLPEEIKKQIPALDSQNDINNPVAYVKLFTPGGAFVWFITQFDQEDNDTCFGYIFEQDEGEFGYFSLHSLQEQRPMITFQTLDSTENATESSSLGGNAPSVERDPSFIPKRLSEAQAEYRKHIDNLE